MNILLISGHTEGYNYAPKTKSNEGKLNIDLTKLLVKELKPYCDVDFYPYERDAYIDRKKGVYLSKYDFKKYRYIFEIHFNSYDSTAQGFSVQIHSKYKGGISVERNICKNMAKYFKARGDAGIVTRDDLLNMNTAYKQNVDYALIEVCFHDNPSDYSTYIAYKENIAKDIAKGIIDGFGLTSNKTIKVKDCKDLNIRKGPGMQYDVIDIVPVNTDLIPIVYEPDVDGDYWLKVKNPSNNKVGYVWPKYVS